MVPTPSSTLSSLGPIRFRNGKGRGKGRVSTGQSLGLPSDPSPDDLIGDPDPLSCNKDLYLFAEQGILMTRSLNLQVTSSIPKPQDKILGRLYSDTPGTIAFPVPEGVLDFIKAI